MNQLLVLICILTVEVFTICAQTSETSDKIEGKYFEYTILENSRGAKPLFAIPIHENPDMILAEAEVVSYDWTVFTSRFVEHVLKKYLTIAEIRKMLKEGRNGASATLVLDYDYYGNIRYAMFVFDNDLKEILTDEKLYLIYQDLINMKIDTTGFYWWVNQERPTEEQKKKIFGTLNIPFFSKKNCP